MANAPDPQHIAGELIASIRLLVRRVRQIQPDSQLTLSETSALSRLDRGGPTTSSALAKQEQISPQSMGATVAALQVRGFIRRDNDPDDGRRVLLSLTEDGGRVLRDRRSRRTELVGDALSSGFSAAELRRLEAAAPLIERLAQQL